LAKHDAGITLAQMRDHVREALDIAKGKTREDFTRDRLLNLSLTRLLEILGEAANRVPPEVQSKHPDIPWPELVGLRNRLIHAYDDVDLEILWEIVTQDLPPLARTLERIANT
jgi:uncharacterized protein with HEPN domain